jgi:hypothetical protein
LSAWHRSLLAARQRPNTACHPLKKQAGFAQCAARRRWDAKAESKRNPIMRTLSTIGIAMGIGIILAIAFTTGLFLPELARTQSPRGPQETFAIARWN